MHAPLYETDFYQWTQTRAAALRAKDLAALDLDHLAEGIKSLGASDRRAIHRRLTVLTQHLLKLGYQPQERGTRGAGWRSSIRNARRQIELILTDSPSLRGFLPEALAWAYRHGRVDAADETGLPPGNVPGSLPVAARTGPG